MLTTSCTHALEMAALLLNIQPGDEVIVPSFTFVSTVNAFALRGATPVFVDIRPDTLNLDESRMLERLIDRRTRAIVVVHYAGVGCEMDAIMRRSRGRTASRSWKTTRTDCSARYQRPAARHASARLPTLSFHETKNFTCGEGGALGDQRRGR